MTEHTVTRRALLAAAPALLGRPSANAAGPGLRVAIFSKHLQFVRGEELAKTAAELGFDAVDITVRKGGHVEPARVRQELPGLVGMIRRRGLTVPMITTDIVDTGSPFAEDILKTMAELEIRYYRWGGLTYAADRPYAAQLEQMKPRIARLAEWTARYGACAMYHTHSGTGVVGASIWDLHLLLRDLDPKAVGVNYDVGHATVEGGLGGWINSFRITGGHLRGIAVKDFVWGKDAKGEWEPQWTPLGEGMVRFGAFFHMVAEAGFSGPLQLHFEYPLGGANDGKTTLTVPKEEALAAMKRDLGKLRAYLAEGGLAG